MSIARCCCEYLSPGCPSPSGGRCGTGLFGEALRAAMPAAAAFELVGVDISSDSLTFCEATKARLDLT